ncbi:MAG: rhombosortase [Planctomycetota bacterium]|jgi:rhomboid family GlyGly-CTERM serine protease
MGKKPLKSLFSHVPIVTLLVLFASVLSFVSSQISSVFIFDRNAAVNGEVWRLLTAHFVHFTPVHLAYNLLIFGVVGSIVEKKSSRRFGLLCVLMAFFISTSLFILRPAMGYYGGLSGMACGSIYYCALLGARKPHPWRTVCTLIIFLLPIKIVLEVYNDGSILPYGGQQPFVTMPISHIIGIVVAVLFYLAVVTDKTDSKERLNIGHQTGGLRAS